MNLLKAPFGDCFETRSSKEKLRDFPNRDLMWVITRNTIMKTLKGGINDVEVL